MAEFLRGVALDSQDALVRAQILQQVDLSSPLLTGTSVIVGYGTDPHDQSTPLHVAVFAGDADLAQLLVRHYNPPSAGATSVGQCMAALNQHQAAAIGRTSEKRQD